MEPHTSIVIDIKNQTRNADVNVYGLTLPMQKIDNAQVMDNYKTNVIQVSRINPITKDFQFRFDLKSISESSIMINGIFISSGENKYKQIPINMEE